MTDSSKSFSQFDLHPDLVNAIQAMGYNQCTPIQERCVPLVLKGQDIAGLAQTGTGKTAAFLIPLIERVLRSMNANGAEGEERPFKEWKQGNFVMILVPTRELVGQVHENLELLTKGTQVSNSVFLYGGVGYDEQKDALKKPFQFLVATPGRLIDLYKEGFVDFKQVRAVVFDEADRMFDMGFQQDVLYILRRIPQDRQLLMFSATLNLHVTEMAYSAHSHPVEIDVSRDKVTTENIEDFIFHVRTAEKPKFLLSILKKYNPAQVIIFSNYKNKVPRIAQFLNDNNYPALGISSLLTQSQRNRVIERFKSENKHNIMVATDLAARGLDIKGVDLVINYELPEDAENYVHRIGRTGRAEHKGQAISFISDKDVDSMVRIEEYLKEKLEVAWLEETEYVTDFKSMPADESRRSSFGGPRRDAGGGGGGGSRGPRRDGAGGGGRGPRPEGRRDGPREGNREGGRGPRRDHSDRPPRDQNRPPRENTLEAHDGDAPVPQERPNNNVHRDKRLGRHRDSQPGNRTENRGERTDNRGDRSRPQARSGGGGGSRNDRNQPRGRGGRDNRPDNRKRHDSNRRPAAAAPQKSLWGRITASVKKLVKKK